MNSKAKRLTLLAMFAAVAFVVMLVGRIPISMVDFLKYDPKDIVIVISGFIAGPAAAFTVTVVVALIEMITVSTTGFIGLAMNIISSAAFACTASLIYKKNRTLQGAVLSLVAGGLVMVFAMLAWNYLVTPFYMKVTREQIAAMLLSVFLPFNAIKAILNAVITLVIYKPVSRALFKSGIISGGAERNAGKFNPAVTIVCLLIFATCIFVILAMKGII